MIDWNQIADGLLDTAGEVGEAYVTGRPTNTVNNSAKPATTSKPFNWKPWAIGIGLAVVAFVALPLLLRRKK